MKPKNLILVILALFVLNSCGETNEEKAQKMAAEYLKGSLYHFDSYEPLQTTVDSLFVSLMTDEEERELTLDMLKLFESLSNYSNKANEAEREMELWSPTYYATEYMKGEYKRAKEEREKNINLMEKTVERIENQFDKIKSRQSEIRKGEFIGWKVYHKFKSLNGAKTVDLFGEYIFFCDENFNEKAAFQIDEFESMSKLMNTIAEANSLEDFFHKWQEQSY